MENNKKQYKANVNLEIYFNNSTMAHNKSLCEIKLKMILRMFEELLDKDSICCLTQFFDIEEDDDDLEVFFDKVRTSETNVGEKDMKISSNMVDLLINALGERYNKNFEKSDKELVKRENEEIIRIIKGLVADNYED